MKKTFLVGFMGLFLVGGFLTGMYLISQPTNPASSASEVVNPVKPPENNRQTEIQTPTENPQSYSLEKCQPLYGKSNNDSGFETSCDLDSNGMINVLDLQKMK